MRIVREQSPSKVRKSRENPVLSDFHDFFVGLIFRKCYFETAALLFSGHVLLVRNGFPRRGRLCQYFACQGGVFFRNMTEWRYNSSENILTSFINIDRMGI